MAKMEKKEETFIAYDNYMIYKSFFSEKEKQLNAAINNSYKGKARLREYLDSNAKKNENDVNKYGAYYYKLDACLKEAREYKKEVLNILNKVENRMIDTASLNKCIEYSKRNSKIDKCIDKINDIKDETRKIVDRGIVYQIKKLLNSNWYDKGLPRGYQVKELKDMYYDSKEQLDSIEKQIERIKNNNVVIISETDKVIKKMDNIPQKTLEECLNKGLKVDETISVDSIKTWLANSRAIIDEKSKDISKEIAGIKKEIESINDSRLEIFQTLHNEESGIKEIKSAVNDFRGDVENLNKRIQANNSYNYIENKINRVHKTVAEINKRIDADKKIQSILTNTITEGQLFNRLSRARTFPILDSVRQQNLPRPKRSASVALAGNFNRQPYSKGENQNREYTPLTVNSNSVYNQTPTTTSSPRQS